MTEPEPDLVVVNPDPFNAETPLHLQVGTITPVRRHYVRQHFPVPEPPDRVRVGGAVRTPLALALDELHALASRSLVVTLECAGNGRAFLDPPAPGEQWRLGAVGTAEWTGVPLATVLDMAQPLPRAVEVLFRGTDAGTPKDLGRRIAFERSLPLDRARSRDVLLAYAMNGEPLTPEHGAPLRLVVSGWYGMASVKWLAEIVLVEEPFRGFYQADRYVIDGKPLTRIEPRAVIVAPPEGAALARRPFRVRGYCWAGGVPVERVELSTDGGGTWTRAALGEVTSPYAWREWQHQVEPRASGELVLLARAVDGDGCEQPLTQRYNALGYANNAARPVRVTIAG